MTTARRELKVSVTDQGQTLASWLMSAFSKDDNALVWRRSSIKGGGNPPPQKNLQFLPQTAAKCVL